MRLTIIKDDNKVLIDGKGYEVDCTDLPDTFHALHWNGVSGEVEHRPTLCSHCGARSKKANEVIFDVSPYQSYIDGWNAAKTDAEAKAEAEAKEREAADAKAAEEDEARKAKADAMMQQVVTDAVRKAIEGHAPRPES